MSDETETPEATINRMAYQIMELENWQRKYAMAAELWDNLGILPNQMVTEALVLAKVIGMEKDFTALAVGHTPGCDWFTRLGLVAAFQQVENSDGPVSVDDEED